MAKPKKSTSDNRAPSMDDVFNEYHKQVFGFAFKNLKSRSLSEDVVQEVFFVMCQKDLSKIQNIRSYIFQITHHKVIDLLRQRAKNQQLRKEMWNVISEKQQAADQELLEKEYFESLEKAKSCLTPQQKIIFELSRREGLSHRKIAEQLNLSPNTVKNHMVSALKTLREYLQINSDVVISILMSVLLF